MTTYNPACFDKIVNPDLARAALHGVAPYGEFMAYVRLAKPEEHPTYMSIEALCAPDLIKARIPCDQMDNLAEDTNVLSVELREHISGLYTA